MSMLLRKPKKTGIHGLTLALGQAELRSTANLPKIKQVARESRSKYLVVGHGSYFSTTQSFYVPDNVYIIFLARAEMYLPKTALLNSELTRFLTYPDKIRKMLSGEIENDRLPEYLKDWKTRFFGPGDRCRNIEIVLDDQLILGTGVTHLPLHHSTQLKNTEGFGAGYTAKLADITQRKGVYFVGCCRKSESLHASSSRYTPRNVFASYANTMLAEKSASETLLKRKAINSPIVRSAKKRRVSSVLRTN